MKVDRLSQLRLDGATRKATPDAPTHEMQQPEQGFSLNKN
jgi:hypothetical protein